MEATRPHLFWFPAVVQYQQSSMLTINVYLQPDYEVYHQSHYLPDTQDLTRTLTLVIGLHLSKY